MVETEHTHIDKDGNTVTHTHVKTSEDIKMSEHGHYHSPKEKKKQINRISKAIGHLQHVKSMLERDEDCSDVLIQLAAVESALHGLGKEIISEHLTHCIIHAIEDGNKESIDEFQKAIKKYF